MVCIRKHPLRRVWRFGGAAAGCSHIIKIIAAETKANRDARKTDFRNLDVGKGRCAR